MCQVVHPLWSTGGEDEDIMCPYPLWSPISPTIEHVQVVNAQCHVGDGYVCHTLLSLKPSIFDCKGLTSRGGTSLLWVQCVWIFLSGWVADLSWGYLPLDNGEDILMYSL